MIGIFILTLQICIHVLVQILFFPKLGNIAVIDFTLFITHFLFIYSITTSDADFIHLFPLLLMIIWIGLWKSNKSILQIYWKQTKKPLCENIFHEFYLPIFKNVVINNHKVNVGRLYYIYDPYKIWLAKIIPQDFPKFCFWQCQNDHISRIANKQNR